MSFDLTSIPTGAFIQEAALDITTSNEGGSGTISQLELRTLTAPFTEGSGSGLSDTPADPNTNSGANWNRRSDATANLTWNNTGGSLGTTVLSTLAGYNASSGTSTAKTFPTSPDFTTAVQSAIESGRLGLTVVSPPSPKPSPPRISPASTRTTPSPKALARPSVCSIRPTPSPASRRAVRPPP